MNAPAISDYIRSCLAQKEHFKLISTKDAKNPQKNDQKCLCTFSYRGLQFEVVRSRSETLEEDEKGRYSKQYRFNFKVTCLCPFLHSEVISLLIKEALFKGGHPELSKDPII